MQIEILPYFISTRKEVKTGKLSSLVPSFEGVAFGREGLNKLLADDFESDGHGAVGGLADDGFSVSLDSDLVRATEGTVDFALGADGDLGGGGFALAKNEVLQGVSIKIIITSFLKVLNSFMSKM